MKQLLLRKGVIDIKDVPAPMGGANNVLVEVSKSLISTGTEMSTVKLSGASLAQKASQRPKEVLKVLNSIRVRGVKRTFALVQSRLDESIALGYSCMGKVIAVGKNVTHIQAGDRVACAGAKIASHAEIVSVPKNLVVKVPPDVDNASAAFVTVGAIALQGVRRADPRLGETVCVVGLGLLGQITVQLLHASGCRVIGMDPDSKRVEEAKKFGLSAGASSPNELAQVVQNWTSGVGVDATILTASTPSSDPTRQAFQITRKKGKVVVVGAVGMNLDRSPFYEKEQDFLISCSYGPGRYDARYEQDGEDYPLAFVRWTENRNMQAFLELLQTERVTVRPLVGKELPLDKANQAYELLKGKEKPLAILLDYPGSPTEGVKTAPVVHSQTETPVSGQVGIGFIGLGNFIKTTHLPTLRDMKETVAIRGVCTAKSAHAESMGRQLKASAITTDYTTLLGESSVQAVVVGTRHDTHAAIVRDALSAGKHVFVEKPLALEEEELGEVADVLQRTGDSKILLVGFNRRFAPLTDLLRSEVRQRRSPLIATFRVNAGALPADHWTKTKEGGGRLRGEACHMIDFFRSLVEYPLKEVSIEAVHASQNDTLRPDENFSAQFLYEDGSLCNLIYTSLGDKRLAKEYVEVHWDGHSAIISDFRSIQIFGAKPVQKSGPQDKGHVAIMNQFIHAIQQGNRFPIPWDELYETTHAAIELDKAVWGHIQS